MKAPTHTQVTGGKKGRGSRPVTGSTSATKCGTAGNAAGKKRVR